MLVYSPLTQINLVLFTPTRNVPYVYFLSILFKVVYYLEFCYPLLIFVFYFCLGTTTGSTYLVFTPGSVLTEFGVSYGLLWFSCLQGKYTILLLYYTITLLYYYSITMFLYYANIQSFIFCSAEFYINMGFIYSIELLIPFTVD